MSTWCCIMRVYDAAVNLLEVRIVSFLCSVRPAWIRSPLDQDTVTEIPSSWPTRTKSKKKLSRVGVNIGLQARTLAVSGRQVKVSLVFSFPRRAQQRFSSRFHMFWHVNALDRIEVCHVLRLSANVQMQRDLCAAESYITTV